MTARRSAPNQIGR